MTSRTVYCTVREVIIDNVPSVEATCSQCDHRCSAFGRHEGSIKRALASLRSECPEGESNFYEASEIVHATAAQDAHARRSAVVAPNPVPKILICTSMKDTHLEPLARDTIERYLKRRAEIVAGSALNWNLIRRNERGWDAAYRFVVARHDLFCLCAHSDTGALSRGVYTIGTFALAQAKLLVLWTPAGTLRRVSGLRKTGFDDWKKDYGEAIVTGETAVNSGG